jgi:hypothetical protein
MRARLVLAAVAVLGLAFGSTGGAAYGSEVRADRPGASKGDGSQAGGAASGDALAVALAKARGKRVEVVSRRTEAGQVFAEPDGTFTAELSARPERVRAATGWVTPDTTLRLLPDGTVRPVATSWSLAFSGGGRSAPLVRLAQGDKRLDLSWPGVLPEPTLRGDTATYAEVLPGVDLRLTAKVQGFSKVLVVKDRRAAADPRLASIQFGLSTAGLKFARIGGGGLAVKDSTGAVVFASPAAQMWDSPGDGRAAQRRSAGVFRLTPGRLTVVPDRKLLRDRALRFPVLIDPDLGMPNVGWTKVFSGYPNDSYWYGNNDDADAKVGRCYTASGACNGVGVARSFWQYDITSMRGADILGAEFNLHATHSPSCDARGFRVYETDRVSQGTTWNAQPGGWIGPIGEPVGAWGRTGCPANWVGVGAGPSVSRKLTAGSDVVTFAVTASNEGDELAWRKFDNANLIVHFNWPPDVPSNRWASVGQGPSLGCADDPAKSVSFSSELTMHVTATDRDGQNLQVGFEWGPWGGAVTGSAVTAPQPNGTPHSATIPAGQFGNGSRIMWRARVADGIRWGAYSAWCGVTIDQVPPVRPKVTSTDYPEDGFGGFVGKTGSFTVTTTDTDVVGYQWSLNFQDLPVVDFDSPSFVRATGGTATIRATPSLEGRNDLYVRAVDAARNVSPVYQRWDGQQFVPGGYGFKVGSSVPPPAGYWPLDGHYPSTSASDASGGGRNGTVTGAQPASGAAWTAGRAGEGLRFDGATGYVGTSGGPAVDTSGTFAVSAWARLDRVGNYRAVVSEDGRQTPGFQLQATPDGHWAFAMFAKDESGGGPLHDRVVSPNAAVVGRWTHLLATYDSGADQMRLYVDGVQAAEGIHRDAWAAPGVLTIGRSQWSGLPSDYWPGAVDDVRVWNRLLSDVEIQRLAGSPANEEAFYPLDEGQGTVAADVSGNLGRVALAGGAAWAPGPVGTGALRFDGVDDVATADLPAVRTDGSFTVTARVLLSRLDAGTRTAVSQDGNRVSGFSLQYRADRGRWAFVMFDRDEEISPFAFAEAPGVPTAQEWTHLAGVYDQAARQIRLYVNGALVGSAPYTGEPWQASGPLVIGRGKQRVPIGYWQGGVDDVHVYQGVRTNDEIRNDFLNPATDRPTPYRGQLSRYVDNDGHHYVTAGSPPRGAHLEGAMGLLAPPDAAGTRTLYSCRFAGGQFVSTAPDCEGATHTLLGEIGRLYASAPPGVPSVEVFRCVVTDGTGDHFVSTDRDCEGTQMEGSLGFVRAYRYLSRFVRVDYQPADRLTSATLTGVAGGYRPEAAQGIVAATAQPDTIGLYACFDGLDEFLSKDSGCGGKTLRYWVGNVWTQPPATAQATAQLFSCRMTTTGDRFTSLDDSCEGQTKLGSFGYVITQL